MLAKYFMVLPLLTASAFANIVAVFACPSKPTPGTDCLSRDFRAARLVTSVKMTTTMC